MKNSARASAGAKPSAARLFAASGLVLANHLSFRAFAASPTARAKAVIQIWMWGGPSHMDIFDPKPEAGYDYCGPLKTPIETNVSGIRIGELLPLLAKQADKYSIIRSMTHGNNGHETASYIVQTGRQPGGRPVYPCVGAVVSLTKGYDAGYKGLIPPYVVLTEPQGRFDEAGFFGPRYKPFATGGNPAQTPFAVEGVVLPGVTDQRQKTRRELLHHLDTLAQALPDDPQVTANTQAENMAYDMILGDGAKVFDLSQEKPGAARPLWQHANSASRASSRGGSSNAAFRMSPSITPAGTRTRKISRPCAGSCRKWTKALRRCCRIWQTAACSTAPSSGGAANLAARRKSMWEAPWNGGRDHWGKVFSAVLAGGGFKGGQVVGASDAKGEEVKDRPVYPVDLIGSIYAQLGIEPTTKLPNPEGPADVRHAAASRRNQVRRTC